MKKKLLSLLAISAMTVTLFAGCSSSSKTEQIKVGMVTDSGTIDDKSFNQGTWEGLEKSKVDFETETKYVKPIGTTESDYLKEIGNLYDAGYKFIAAPGFNFQTAIYKAQDKYKDAHFVLIDGIPNDGATPKATDKIGDNTVSILFAEQQSGFLAGVATAVQLKEGELGFIGGMEIPAVQKFNWGFQQGVAYANEKLGAKVSLKAENVVYQGTFSDIAAGQQIAAQMYDKGVKAIFCAAGGVGNGVINEAKARAASGKQVWVVGVDKDQYQEGVGADGKSIILTSAVKKVDVASYNMVKALKDGNFPGGKQLVYDITNDAVGIPEKNPNLSDDTMKIVSDVAAKLKDGSIKVKDSKDDTLIK